MATFHQDRDELHGITVVVDTDGPIVYIGRWLEQDDKGIVLMDVAQHEDGEGGRSKEDYVKHAARVGVWKKHNRLVLPKDQVVSVRRLGEISPG